MLAGDEIREAPEKQKLPRELRARDLAAMSVLIVLYFLCVNSVQTGTLETFSYWLIGLCFLLPSAYVSRWLSVHLSFHGGHYIWIRKLGGLRWGEITGAFTCLYGVFVILTILQGELILITDFEPHWFDNPLTLYGAQMFLVLFCAALALVPLRYLKHMLLLGAGLYISLFLAVGAAGIWWLWQGHPFHATWPVWHGWPAVRQHIGIYGIVMWAFMGVDWPFIMGKEVRGDDDEARTRTGRFIWWACVLIFVAYVIASFGVLVVVPYKHVEAFDAMLLAVQNSFGPLAGALFLILLGFCQIAISIAVFLVCSRMLMFMAYDRLLPRAIGNLSWKRTPFASVLTMVLLCGLIFSLIYVPLYSFSSPSAWIALPGKIVNVVLQALAAVIWSMATLLLYGLLIWACTTRPQTFVRLCECQRIVSWRIMGRVLGVTVVGVLTTLLGGILVLSSSWIPRLLSPSHWTFTIASFTGVVLLLGWLGAELPRQWRLTYDLHAKNDNARILRSQLQKAYDEKIILAQRQQVLLQERDTLFRQHAQLAVTDPVTGLPNHRALMKALDGLLAQSRERGETCALLFIDLDNFKHANDTWGHQAGDFFLHEVGANLRQAVSPQAVVGRYGGEEFVVIVPNISLLQAGELAEHVRVQLQQALHVWSPSEYSPPVYVRLTASIGVVLYPFHGANRGTLLEAADRLMYQAKQGGRNCVRIAGLDTGALSSSVTHTGPMAYTASLQTHALLGLLMVKDPQLYEQGQRIAPLAVMVARNMQSTGDMVLVTRLTAMLHDIGMLALADTCPLRQEANATDLCKHITYGKAIVAEAGDIFSLVAPSIEAHHARWDGLGYPYGLCGEEIPLAARIVAVVDAYDTLCLCSTARSETAICQKLVNCAGTRFDPAVIRAFLQVLQTQQRTTDADLEAIRLPQSQREPSG
ncbi:amino acid permease [Ktedonobacter robiniae]|uniref:Diguanylate cyclase n=1 Tax=Ktedonobacter robiniae TaxID=2778365 RepID=A0ABQ3V734_9CHLR|nr:amino acid permease [Ktedonobacter robiniae]GHO60220.1 hypothetical protein KSB_86950 [Ktedonobacter robiniae]